LDISVNFIQDLNVLKNLKNVTQLWCRENTIEDISALASLTNLSFLDIGTNKIQDISPLQHLTQLTELSCKENEIEDISILQKLTKLKVLNLNGNNIKDIFSIGILPNLEVLDIEANLITNFNFNQISISFPNLKKLFLSNNDISNIPGYITDNDENCLPALKEWMKENETNIINELETLIMNSMNLQIDINNPDSKKYLKEVDNLEIFKSKYSTASTIYALNNSQEISHLNLRHSNLVDITLIKNIERGAPPVCNKIKKIGKKS
jgi:internalin A